MLRNTYVGAWLSLIRIQSVPVTVISLLIGYASVTGTVTKLEVIPLIIVGLLGHTGVYGHNDYVDRKEDEEAHKYHKPIPGGDIKPRIAGIGISILIILSIITAYLYFSIVPLILYIIALIIGLYYNYISSDVLYSPFLMGIWGMIVILLGATYAGNPSVYTWPMILLLGVHMFWMTIEGNLKDIGKDEISLPEYFDCHIYERNDDKQLFVTYRMAIIIHSLILIHFILFLSFPIIAIFRNVINKLSLYSSLYIIHLLITIALAGKVWETAYGVIDQHPFDRDDIKRDIAKHTVVIVITSLFVSILFINIQSIFVLILGSIVWGLGWQTILYSDPLYFP